MEGNVNDIHKDREELGGTLKEIQGFSGEVKTEVSSLHDRLQKLQSQVDQAPQLKLLLEQLLEQMRQMK